MSILSQIIEYKKNEVQRQKAVCRLSPAQLEKQCLELSPVNSFVNSLDFCKSQDKIGLLAEIKKASPSKGLIRKNFKPVEIALTYEKAGVTGISVLTEEKFFLGSVQHFKEVRENVKLPILRKDFIIDSFQILETRLIGADILLLIASALKIKELREFYKLAKEVGLEVLVEVHNQKELDTALDLNSDLIGINNRNLGTFEVSIKTTLDLIEKNDLKNVHIISESGIKTDSDVKILKEAGVSGILVGESLMRQDDIEQAVHNLMPDI